jgi:hypothetical protein
MMFHRVALERSRYWLEYKKGTQTSAADKGWRNNRSETFMNKQDENKGW